MKTTDLFKQTVKEYLDHRAEEDALFSLTYSNPTKNIDDCLTYILNTVKQSGCNGFADDEIFSMAVHYYDEPEVEVGQPLFDCSVVVNHTVELTDEEKAQAYAQAMQKAQDEAYAKIMQPKRKVVKATAATASSTVSLQSYCSSQSDEPDCATAQSAIHPSAQTATVQQTLTLF